MLSAWLSVVAEAQNWTQEHDVALTRLKSGPIPAPQISENQWIRSRMSAAPGAPAPHGCTYECYSAFQFDSDAKS